MYLSSESDTFRFFSALFWYLWSIVLSHYIELMGRGVGNIPPSAVYPYHHHHTPGPHPPAVDYPRYCMYNVVPTYPTAPQQQGMYNPYRDLYATEQANSSNVPPSANTKV